MPSELSDGIFYRLGLFTAHPLNLQGTAVANLKGALCRAAAGNGNAAAAAV